MKKGLRRFKSFDALAEQYDAWYDTPKGRAAFREELLCLKKLKGKTGAPWLEAGAGTGRFSEALGISIGLDPSMEMLHLARKRNRLICQGKGEAQPFPSCTFHGVLINCALCFMQHPQAALQESKRVLVPGGKLLLGMVPPESLWGQRWEKAAREGHPLYSQVTFRSTAETIVLVEDCGFRLRNALSALFRDPATLPTESKPDIRPGINTEGGFIALSFEKLAS